MQGRQLETIQTGNKTISFAYDMDGIRRSKTVVTDTDAKRTTSQTDYITQGGLIVQQTTVTTVLTKSTDATTTTTRVLEFTYDSQQRPFCVLDSYTKTDGTFSQTRYYYVLNLQGDVVALMTASGSIWATYTYDAWGKPLQVLNGSNTALGSTSTYFANVNPLRYRGYYYDTETGFYYLQSRYYDPSVGRFINADAQFEATLNVGLNLFAYCDNSPVNKIDSDGCLAAYIVAAGISAAVIAIAAIAATTYTSQQISISAPASPSVPTSSLALAVYLVPVASQSIANVIEKINERHPGKYSVYQLKNPQTDCIEYAGMTKDIDRRLINAGRNSINSISPKNSKLEAYMYAFDNMIYNEWSNERYYIIEMFPGG